MVPVGLVVPNNRATQQDIDLLPQQCVTMVRQQVGPVASFKFCFAVKALPKTRSGKILRRTVKVILVANTCHFFPFFLFIVSETSPLMFPSLTIHVSLSYHTCFPLSYHVSLSYHLYHICVYHAPYPFIHFTHMYIYLGDIGRGPKSISATNH
jgi:hypothetical protein